MSWQQAMEVAHRRSERTGRKFYVRGYIRQHFTEYYWVYGAYAVSNPHINRRDRPIRWWD